MAFHRLKHATLESSMRSTASAIVASLFLMFRSSAFWPKQQCPEPIARSVKAAVVTDRMVQLLVVVAASVPVYSSKSRLIK